MTPAVKLLERHGVTHRVAAYDHDPRTDSFGLEAAAALGVDADLVYKTLVVTLDTGGKAVAIVPVTAKLDLKALAATAGAKKAAMADHTDAERVTGYVRGGISPLGQRKRLPTFIDEGAKAAETIYVSGGKRGLDIELSPIDLAELLDATFSPIASTVAGTH